MKNISFFVFLSENFLFLEVKFSIYLNRVLFVMIRMAANYAKIDMLDVFISLVQFSRYCEIALKQVKISISYFHI